MSATTQAVVATRRRTVLDADDWVVRGALIVFGVYFLVTLIVPLFMMISRSVQNINGEFVGLANYA
ncbi:MAG: putative 2-aminoethylphosphonate ABC transporter permease subunit, partial [Gammaproteobacteria bacterium]|nr:putative 2-aminoethylphosphonate ABC transporter permease subunit [Gammaproteobacteria bacterium]NIV48505.1 putative 2-aminoethylphosphonate ABC transporter permease subunit [Gammaproteobacteria bacterium]NIW56108.1 putative 2-aminoethylphosphonate ABC transporter permease subunit [Gammaproteobacteria bacterium]NIX05080.1 putative 2-aminoethylphosphonate ABC transporter permease subunit [Gammaproteobacteria bacterium]